MNDTQPREVVLVIQGMTCDHCVSTVRQALGRLGGVDSAEVTLDPPRARATFDPKLTATSEMIEAIAKAGFSASVAQPAGASLSGSAQGKRLLIIGGGSAAFAAAVRASDLGAEAVIVNEGLPIGGTCVNVGCVPSKTLIRAAESVRHASHARFPGVQTDGRLSDFRAVIEHKRRLVEELRQAKYVDVAAQYPGIRITRGKARIVAPDAIEVAGERLEGDAILIATGAAPLVPPIPGIEDSGYLTNETAFELEELPESMIVIGGRYIALETAQMFARFGSKVTVLQRSDRILPTEGADLTDALTGYLTDEGIEIVTGVSLKSVGRENGRVVVTAEVRGEEKRFTATHLLAATGRRPNTDCFGLEDTGVALDERGFVKVDESLRTSAASVFAAGDVIGSPMFVYTAAYEGALAAENALLGSAKARDYTALPWVIFTDPQVAGVGLDEDEARRAGIDAESALLPLSYVPRALAANDTRGFVKLIRDRATDRIIGARILAPEGGELLMEIALAIRHDLTVSDLASAFHPYLTLSEAVKLAALSFGKDVKKLSCCAT